jgi:hypothetical protein
MFMIDVVGVKWIEGYTLELQFEDGLIGLVAIDEVIKTFDGIFEPLADPTFFQRVAVSRDLGTIVWPNGADICPDVLYSFVSGTPHVAEQTLH